MPNTSTSFSRRTLFAGGLALAAGSSLPTPTLAQAIPEVNYPAPLRDPAEYKVYIPCASKTGPFFDYTCEFDSAWAILKTFDIDTTFQEQLQLIPIDMRLEPYYVYTDTSVIIYGGDITSAYSGDYTSNFLCRTTAPVMARVFEHYDLETEIVKTEEQVRQQLDKGRLIFIKITVDFKEWQPATWITPEGVQIPVVLGNDHAMVVMGYNDDVVVIRDTLGPTSTNWERPYELEVPWDLFMTCWSSEDYDGLAVGKPETH